MPKYALKVETKWLFYGPDSISSEGDNGREIVALRVDVETTGLDHRRHEVIEIGMVAFVNDAEGSVGSVVGVLGMMHEPKADITRLPGITAKVVASQSLTSPPCGLGQVG